MGNCSIHHVHSVQDIIRHAQSKIIYLPPYSLDLMPLEEALRKVKMEDCNSLFQVLSAPRALITSYGVQTDIPRRLHLVAHITVVIYI